MLLFRINWRNCKYVTLIHIVYAINIFFSKRLEQTLRPFVYDSPLEQPMFENVRYFSAIYNVTQQQTRLDESGRSLRKDFLENVVGRIVSILINYKIMACNILTWFILLGAG